MSGTQQPEALVFADDRPTSTSDDLYQWAIDAEDLIRAQHARIEDLEAQLSAIGAGGVEPLRKQAAVPQAVPVAWRYQTQTGWHATTDADAAIRVNAHHPIEPLYTHPTQQGLEAAKAQRVPLSVEAIAEIAERFEVPNPTDSFWVELCRAFEGASVSGITQEKQ